MGYYSRKAGIMIKYISHDLKDTEKLGLKLGEILKKGDFINISGDLGTGKTTLTKSIGKGLGVSEYITSPTFNLINEYNGRLRLYHFDVYRLKSPEEMFDLGYEEYFYSDGVTIIEWGNNIVDMLPKERLDIYMDVGINDNERKIFINGKGKRYIEMEEELKRIENISC